MTATVIREFKKLESLTLSNALKFVGMKVFPELKSIEYLVRRFN